MKPLPHHYQSIATSAPQGRVALTANDLPTIESGAPADFGGPGDCWSPEDLLVAAVADCFILTFRAVARAAGLSWTSLQCDAEGLLERVDRQMKFTRFDLTARLTVVPEVDATRAKSLLAQAEKGCLVSNSLSAETRLSCSVEHA